MPFQRRQCFAKQSVYFLSVLQAFQSKVPSRIALCESFPSVLQAFQSKVPSRIAPLFKAHLFSQRPMECTNLHNAADLPPAPEESRGNAEFLIFAYGNSFQEAERANHIIDSKDLKLPKGAVLLLAEQMPQNVIQNGYFKADLYFEGLSTLQFGRLLLWSPRLPSTQTLLSQNFHALPVGTVCVADVQLQGKGRVSNVWASPLGCLMFSFTLQMENGRVLPFLQYVVSLAMIEAIESYTIQKDLPTPKVKIKWPNDLYANCIKIGGVLCTSTYRDKKFNIVVGIGLNVSNRQPTTCLDALLQDLVVEAPSFGIEELLACFFKRFEDLFRIFLDQGFSALEASYYEKWLHSGQVVVLEERREGYVPTVKVSLTVEGLSPTGYLLAVDEKMEKYELHPDGNSFDFLKGLIRTKLPS